MEAAVRNRFMKLWKQFFNGAPLPITFYYTDKPVKADTVKLGAAPRCIIGGLAAAQKGQNLAYDAESVGCPGGKRYLGFADALMPNFEYFLSCGIPGKMEGERYKKSPELVKDYLENQAPPVKAPAKYIVFKRWDMLEAADNPEVVIFFATPDVLSGLFTLAVFDENDQYAVIAPFGSGCASIVQYPYQETQAERPKGVIGMMDVSARPFVPEDVLSFAAPMSKFSRMIENMEESFLITESWRKVQGRKGSRG